MRTKTIKNKIIWKLQLGTFHRLINNMILHHPKWDNSRSCSNISNNINKFSNKKDLILLQMTIILQIDRKNNKKLQKKGQEINIEMKIFYVQ